jgi:hypothetical protein
MTGTVSSVCKLNPAWIEQTRRDFLEFLEATNFPHPQRNGERGSRFDYPEWLIMLIAVLAVKCKVQSYLGIHRLAVQYWPLLTPELNLAPISESQLRDRLKKIGHAPGKPAGFIFQIFPAKDLA